MKLYKAARLLHPGRANFVPHDDDAIRELVTQMPAIGMVTTVDALIEERERYLQLTKDCTTETDLQGFYRSHKKQIPAFGAAARAALVYHTTSADSERVFSVLKYVT
jgi:hypothetical protein